MFSLSQASLLHLKNGRNEVLAPQPERREGPACRQRAGEPPRPDAASSVSLPSSKTPETSPHTWVLGASHQLVDVLGSKTRSSRQRLQAGLPLESILHPLRSFLLWSEYHMQGLTDPFCNPKRGAMLSANSRCGRDDRSLFICKLDTQTVSGPPCKQDSWSAGSPMLAPLPFDTSPTNGRVHRRFQWASNPLLPTG